MQGGKAYVADDHMTVLDGDEIYCLDAAGMTLEYKLPGKQLKQTIKASNGKFIKWMRTADGIGLYLSDDRERWAEVKNPEIELTNRCSSECVAYYDVIWTGEVFLIRPTTSDSDYSPTDENGCLLVLDSELQKVDMDVPARLINDKTLVPLRFLSEELDFQVEWADVTQTASIRK